MAGLADGVVLIAESGKTHRAGLMRTRAILENAGAHILGVVLNKLDYGVGKDIWLRIGYGYYYSPATANIPMGALLRNNEGANAP